MSTESETAGNRETLEDMLQEAAVRLVIARRSKKTIHHPEAWKSVVARNLLRDHARREATRRSIEGEYATLEEGVRQRSLNFPESLLEAAAEMIAEEPVWKRRRCVELYWQGGLNSAEISEHLRIPQNTVLSHLHRFKKKLAVRLRQTT
jgi:RNA polymerase sigma factor (sigma-70 family)